MDVIVFLLETVPIAGVSLLRNTDLCTVNFIFSFFPRCQPKQVNKIIGFMVEILIVGGVEIVDIPKSLYK